MTGQLIGVRTLRNLSLLLFCVVGRPVGRFVVCSALSDRASSNICLFCPQSTNQVSARLRNFYGRILFFRQYSVRVWGVTFHLLQR